MAASTQQVVACVVGMRVAAVSGGDDRIGLGAAELPVAGTKLRSAFAEVLPFPDKNRVAISRPLNGWQNAICPRLYTVEEIGRPVPCPDA